MVGTCCMAGVSPLLGSGLLRCRNGVTGLTEMVFASIGPALKASVNSELFGAGHDGILPAKASVPSAVRKVAIPPAFGWLVIIGIADLPSNICEANIVRARLGPTSKNNLAPASYIVLIWVVHSTLDAICGASLDKAAAFESPPSSSGYQPPSTLLVIGIDGQFLSKFSKNLRRGSLAGATILEWKA